MPHLKISDLKHKAGSKYPKRVKTLVVGAGMSGLYSTWRIMSEAKDEDICIFERSDRTGGRLDSDLVKIGDETIKEEQGGMRFTFDSMDDLMTLFLELGLTDQIVPFPMSSGGNNRLFFRGLSFNKSQSADNNYEVWSDLYNLNQSEEGINPNEIINTVFNRILDANPEIKKEIQKGRGPKFWQNFRLDCYWEGVAMKDWSLWNLLMNMGYSNECVTMLYRLLGFNGTFLSKMNAGVAYQLLEDFPSEPDFKTLLKGFSELPNALVNNIGADKIFLKTEVESIDGDPERGYTVTYTPFNSNEASTLIADKVILALPRLALEKLFVRSNALNNIGNADEAHNLWDTLQTTSNQPLLKINLYFDKAWWGNSTTGQPSVDFGPNFSDLPLGSVYPFYSIDEELVASLEYQKWAKNTGREIPANIQALLDEYDQGKYDKPAALTIYCDYLNINFWKALQDNGPVYPTRDDITVPDDMYPASQRVVETAMGFFKKLFNTSYIPQPIATSARIWEGSTLYGLPKGQQFGYGVHQWALHADDKKTMEVLTEPIRNLYTCGEAFSDYQGWVEGALRSADLILKKGWSLAPISEVYKEQTGKTSSEAVKRHYAVNVFKNIATYIYGKLDGDEALEAVAALDITQQITEQDIVNAQGTSIPTDGDFAVNLRVLNKIADND